MMAATLVLWMGTAALLGAAVALLWAAWGIVAGRNQASQSGAPAKPTFSPDQMERIHTDALAAYMRSCP